MNHHAYTTHQFTKFSSEHVLPDKEEKNITRSFYKNLKVLPFLQQSNKLCSKQ
uniref:Uncharacterized protein n=1 Tax=Rhizophora mucronata TaxID=61149 RepID=A0A2P2PH88_RHIMU